MSVAEHYPSHPQEEESGWPYGGEEGAWISSSQHLLEWERAGGMWARNEANAGI
jgi:hypothetical protein